MALSGTKIQHLEAEYAWEEVRRVIRGRNVLSEEKYLAIERHGRKRPLSLHERRAIWNVSEHYGLACEMAKVFDSDSLIQRAYQLLRRSRLRVAFDAIVVDEAQDLTECALRLLLIQLKDHHEGRLLLVGDGGQSIYPGGYRLSELGVETRGRSTILRDAYRSTDGILTAIARVGRTISAEDFGEGGLGTSELRPRRSGPPPEVRAFADAVGERLAIFGYLGALDAPQRSGTALLTLSNRLAREWVKWLRAAGFSAVRLDEYEGLPVPGRKVGTYARSKGLEFLCVILPGISDGAVPAVDLEDQDTYFLQARQLYVAMARAKDELWMSYIGSPSLLITDLIAARDDAMPSISPATG